MIFSLIFSLIGLYYVNRISTATYSNPIATNANYALQKKQK